MMQKKVYLIEYNKNILSYNNNILACSSKRAVEYVKKHIRYDGNHISQLMYNRYLLKTLTSTASPKIIFPKIFRIYIT